MANTKLSKEQKKQLKAWRKAICNNGEKMAVAYDENCGTTAYVEMPFAGAEFAHFSLSFTSADEKKSRPSVGEFCAISRAINGGMQPVRTHGRHPLDIAIDIAHGILY